MRTVLRNIIVPLLIVAPISVFAAFVARDTTQNFPEYYQRSLLAGLWPCALAFAILVAVLYVFKRAGAMLGFCIGLAPGLIIGFVLGGFALAMLGMSGAGGLGSAAASLNFTLPLTTGGFLGPPTLCACLGALIGNSVGARSALSRPAQQGRV